MIFLMIDVQQYAYLMIKLEIHIDTDTQRKYLTIESRFNSIDCLPCKNHLDNKTNYHMNV